MSVQVVQMLDSKATVEPRQVDEEIDEVFKKHPSMRKAKQILAKQWIEGSFFTTFLTLIS